jgi:hypothetical protein
LKSSLGETNSTSYFRGVRGTLTEWVCLVLALNTVIDEGDEACCDDDTEVVRWEEAELDE